MKKINKISNCNPNQNTQSSIEIADSKEYGATQSAILFARKIKLDLLISPKNAAWSKDVLALIIGKLINREVDGPLLFQSITESFAWKLCGHPEEMQPDYIKNYVKPLDQLLSKQKAIQKRIAEKKLLETASGHKSPGKKKIIFSHRLNSLNVITTHEGCPIALDIFPTEPSIDEIHDDLSNKYFWNQLDIPIVYIGDLHPEELNRTNLSNKKLNIIGRLTLIQIQHLIDKGVIQEDLISEDKVVEVVDPLNAMIRYICIDKHNVIYTQLENASLSHNEILKAYEKKIELRLFFKSQISSLMNIRPYPLDISSNYADNHTNAMAFLLLLVQYLEWHIEQKLIHAVNQDIKNGSTHYTAVEAIEKLKSIKLQLLKTNSNQSTPIITSVNDEHQKIIKALEIDIDLL